jgi:hypothetical protein
MSLKDCGWLLFSSVVGAMKWLLGHGGDTSTGDYWEAMDFFFETCTKKQSRVDFLALCIASGF